MRTKLVTWTSRIELTLILAPFSAIYLAYIFMLRPEIAANTMGNIVGPCSWSEKLDSTVLYQLTSCIANSTFVPKSLSFVGFPLSLMTVMPRTATCEKETLFATVHLRMK
jgi:hypothetical protein